MAASPAHADQICNLTEVYGVCFRTYWALKADFIAKLDLHFRDLASADVQTMWYADYDARNALKNVVSWLARTYKLFFINMSKLTGNRWVERDYPDELLAAAKCQMKVLVQKMIAEYAKFDEQTYVAEMQFIEAICLMDDWPTEDLAGGFGHLAVKCIRDGRPHYKEWRR